MTFPLDRTNWKKPRSFGITATEREDILSAIRSDPGNMEGIAARFDLSPGTIAKMAQFARGGRP